MQRVTFGMIFEEGSRSERLRPPHGSRDTQFNSLCHGSIY